MKRVADENSKDKMLISYSDYIEVVNYCIELIEVAGYKPDVIVGIERGGCIPAVQISHHLNTDYTTAVKVSDNVYDVQEDRIGGNILLVDDIADTGATFQNVSTAIWSSGRIATCSLYKRYNSIHTPNFFAKNVEKNSWLVFPWEDLSVST